MPGRGGPARLRRAAFGVVAVLVLGSCSLLNDGPDAAPLPSPSAAPSPAPGLGGFYDQSVSWQSCRDDFECAEVQVPLDYADPGGETVTLSLLRVPATDQDHRVGSLLVNPGGPGASGKAYAATAESAFGPRVRAVFDVVGMDPRGVGDSTPVDCVSDAAMDAVIAADPTPDSAGEWRAGVAATRAFGRACLRRAGDPVRHVSTVEVARDLDVVRQVLGDDSLAYFGASYGTFIGATYADLFPERVGRMVLDGAIDPSLSRVRSSLDQAAGFEDAFTSYVDHCLAGDDCYLGDSVAAASRRVSGLLRRLDRAPLPTEEGRRLTEGLATYGVAFPLYSESLWKYLDVALKGAFDGDGTGLLALADAYARRGPDGYQENLLEVYQPISCLDDGGGLRWRQARAAGPEFLDASPTFGRSFAAGTTPCVVWPVRSAARPHPIEAPAAAPVLVIGTTHDPATPMRWAESLAEQLDSAVLVRRDGEGHTGYRSGNQCVDDTVDDYLVGDAVPEGPVDC